MLNFCAHAQTSRQRLASCLGLVILLLACGPAPTPTGQPTSLQDTASSPVDAAKSDAPPAAIDATTADAGEPDPALLSKSLDDWCKPWTDLVCKRSVGCGCILPGAQPLTAANCQSVVGTYCAVEYKKIGSMVAAMGLSIRKDQVAKCLAAMDADLPACVMLDRDFAVRHACYDWIVADYQKNECYSSNLPCPNLMGCNGKVCNFVRKPNGSPCSEQGQCQSGHCGDDTGVCEGPGAPGETCDPIWGCVAPLACVAGKCAKLAPKGAGCQSVAECEAGLDCVAGKCQAVSGACKPGELCGNAFLCVPGGTTPCASHFCAVLHKFASK